jgi:signal transduction histidine kinase
MLPSLSDALPILVVDDDDQMRKTIGDILRYKGYTPFDAPTGHGGLETAARMDMPPAIALVDLRLPDMDGIELVSRLRLVSELTEVVILTGNASLDSAVRALREQSYDYLVKPVAPDYLLSSIDRAAERWRRKSAEAAMRESQERLRRMFEHVRDALFITNAAGEILDANPAACALAGLDVDALRGLTITNVIGVPVPGAANGGSDAEHRVKSRTGQTRIVDVQSATFAPGLSVHTVRDLTERRQLEAELQQSRKMDAIGRLAGGVAHDINNVLTAITCYSELLLGAIEDQDTRREEVIEIRAAAQRAASLTGQLLAFSRKQPLRAQTLDLNAIIASMERMIRTMVGVDVALMLSPDPELWPVLADRGQLEQVILNLAVNARDAMPNGGTLTITTGNVTLTNPRTHRHGTIEPDDYVMLRVADCGSGMTEEVLVHLFEPFFTTKARSAGTGLGLSTVYGIVTQSRGKVEVSSALGVGTEITIYLPRVHDRPGADTREPDIASPAARTATETILLVEDDPALRGLMARLLRESGYHVIAAASGEEALALPEQDLRTVQLVVVDMVMPGLSGRALADRISAQHPTVKILYVSGYTDDELVLRGASDPRRGFLPKPFTTQMLTRRIREMLDGPVESYP